MTETLERVEQAPAVESAPPEQPRAVRLLIGLSVLAALIGLLVTGHWPILAVVAAIFVMVMAHEAGHFFTAKASGMKATEFFVGFGPRLWSMRRGETEYGVKAIPLGGYVRIVGFTALEEIDPADEPRSYMNQDFWKRIVVSSAGSAVHFLLALVLAFGLLAFVGRPYTVGMQVTSLSQWSATSPAEAAGLRPGDLIVAANGHAITSEQVLAQVLQPSVNRPVTLEVVRSGATREIVVTPVDGRQVRAGGQPLVRSGDGSSPWGYGRIGVVQENKVVNQPVSVLGAATGSASLVWSTTTQSVSGIINFFSPSGISHLASIDLHPSTSTSQTALQHRPISLIGIANVGTQAIQTSIASFVELLIVLNIGIGLLNLLPMVPLDGGHVAIAAYEWARTRRGGPRYRADIRKLMPVAYVFCTLLLFVVVSAAFLDLTHPIQLH